MTDRWTRRRFLEITGGAAAAAPRRKDRRFMWFLLIDWKPTISSLRTRPC